MKNSNKNNLPDLLDTKDTLTTRQRLLAGTAAATILLSPMVEKQVDDYRQTGVSPSASQGPTEWVTAPISEAIINGMNIEPIVIQAPEPPTHPTGSGR